jgi:hypothetical protein
MLDKPPIGAPCNGCGLCCVMEVCSSGAVVLGFASQWGERVAGPCPALVEDGEKLVCGILQRPERYVRPGRGPTALRDGERAARCGGAASDGNATFSRPKQGRVKSSLFSF